MFHLEVKLGQEFFSEVSPNQHVCKMWKYRTSCGFDQTQKHPTVGNRTQLLMNM